MRRRVISQWLTIPLKVGQNVRFPHSLQWAGGRIPSALDRSEKPLDTAKDLIYTNVDYQFSYSIVPAGGRKFLEYWSPAALIHCNRSNFNPLDTALHLT